MSRGFPWLIRHTDYAALASYVGALMAGTDLNSSTIWA